MQSTILASMLTVGAFLLTLLIFSHSSSFFAYNGKVRLISQKKRDVHNISARNSGAGNGCADFMAAWHFLVLSAGKPHAHKIPPFRGGVLGFFRRGGWKCQFYFLGRGDFSE